MYNLINAQAIEYYIGDKRSGKSLCMTADTYNDINTYDVPNIKIYTNYKLNSKYFPNLEKINKKDLKDFEKYEIEFKGCIFLIDELQKWYDARNHSTNFNKSLGYFMGQMGKRGNVLRGTLHDTRLIDFRGRLYSDVLIYTFKGLIDKQTGKWEQLENYDRELSDDENERLYIQKNEVIKKLVKTKTLPEFKYINKESKYVKAKDFFDMYESDELIK